MNDPFATLGAPRRFDLDLDALEKTHRELSRALHPDKYAQSPAGERREALERAATVNEAWRTLRDPIKRAEALFALGGVKVGETSEPKASAAFLMDMLEQREALSDARHAKDLSKVSQLGREMDQRARKSEAALATALACDSDLAPALPLLGQLRFYRRFLEEVSAIEDEAES